jgi:hypothetical protein
VDSQEGLNSMELIIASTVLSPKIILKNELSENVNLYSSFILGDQVSINYLHEVIFLQQPILAYLVEKSPSLYATGRFIIMFKRPATVSYILPINITESIR